MKAFKLKISSPEGDLFCEDIVKLSVRGTEGELAVMAGHIPFVTYVKPCDCKIELPDGTERVAATNGGVLTVSATDTLLLLGSLEWRS